MEMLEYSCKELDLWYDPNAIIYPKHEKRHITKYREELAIAQKTAMSWC